jgi:cytidylate kinase
MSVITISSSFGAGGSVVATQVAAALGWRLVNRAIPAEVAEKLWSDKLQRRPTA